MADVVHALDEMSHNLQLFQLYQGLLGVVVDQSDLAAAALVDFLQFWVGFISYLRNNRYRKAPLSLPMHRHVRPAGHAASLSNMRDSVLCSLVVESLLLT
jgi:hypothetical protein